MKTKAEVRKQRGAYYFVLSSSKAKKAASILYSDCSTALSRKLQKARLLINAHVHVCSEADISEFVALRKAGLTYLQISEITGWSQPTICRHVKRAVA